MHHLCKLRLREFHPATGSGYASFYNHALRRPPVSSVFVSLCPLGARLRVVSSSRRSVVHL